MPRTYWTLAETLRKHGKKPPALARASGLSKNTVYDIVNGKTKAVTLETLDKLLGGLEEITGTPMALEDVLRREQQVDIDPELLAQLSNVQPFNCQEIKQLIPNWTDEERAENDQFWRDLETDRLSRGNRRMLKLEALWDELDEPDDTDSEKFVRFSRTFRSGCEWEKHTVLRCGATAGVLPDVAELSGIRMIHPKMRPPNRRNTVCEPVLLAPCRTRCQYHRLPVPRGTAGRRLRRTSRRTQQRDRFSDPRRSPFRHGKSSLGSQAACRSGKIHLKVPAYLYGFRKVRAHFTNFSERSEQEKDTDSVT